MRRQGSPERPLPQSVPGSASATGRSLDALFDPRSITVVGASGNTAKWGHTLSRRALESSGDRPVLLVNRRGAEVLGRRTHRTIAEARDHIGEPLDLVVVCVPAADLVQAVADAVAGGARSLVVITAGLSELGAAGAVAEREAVRLARAAGAVLVGPNCLGVVDTSTELQLSHDLLPVGGVAVLSQSGNVVLDLAALLRDRGLGVSRFVSLGNQADLTVVDLMASCLDHDDTRAVAIYAEDVVDGRAFVTAARALSAAGKPVVLMAPGRSAAAVRSAVSHTGSLTSAYRVVDAACAAAGARRVDNPTQMADLLQGLLADRRMPGRDVAILTDGGGHGAIAGDALAAAGLESPPLSEGTRISLRDQLWQNSVLTNPVDLAGAGEQDPMSYVRALATLLAADEVDGVLVTGYFGGYSTQASTLAPLENAAAQVMLAVVTGQSKPVVVHTIYPDGQTGLLLREGGIPVHRDVDRAAAVLAGLVEGEVLEQEGLTLPPAAPPVTDTSYDGARGLFAEAGVPFSAARTVHDLVDLEAAVIAEEMTFPLVLKAIGRLHKSEGGGVVLGLRDADEVRSAYAAMVARLDPPAVSVESMVDTSSGVEVIVGCVRDPRFGPVLMVGLGGVFAEVLADTALAIAPVSRDGARQLLLSLRGAPLLLGARGRDPVDLDALSTLVSRVSHVAATHPELVELELNPVLAGVSGAIALDARVVPDA
ncbi:MAG: CoA-binding protein [Marmoricola sp.]|nr:CoA-binding protein [Marmoricola sp.]